MMSNKRAIQVHVVLFSLFAVTAAIEYARTGRPNPLGPNFSANTTLSLSILAFIAGIVGFIRTGSTSSIAAGLAFSALYLLGFFRLQAEQRYGYEIALMTSIVLSLGFPSMAVEVAGSPFPREFCLLGVFGTVIFGNAIHFWLALGLTLFIILLGICDDILTAKKETGRS